MSQQPPYGPPDPQQPGKPWQPPGQQPYTPYSQGAYPNPYAQFPPPPKNNTTRNVLLIVGAVVLLFCGGIVAFLAWAISNAEDAFDDDYRGSEDDPITVTEGEAFSIRGFDYEKGWSVSTDESGSIEIEGLRVTNDRDDEDAESLFIHIDFYQDDARLTSVSCSGGGSIAYGRTAVLDCTGFSDKLTDYDEIQVYDTSLYE
ncbi:hypothetical protein [Nocardioides plantarum]|uniref:Uncharacterized protein n=1 Tax=Nocardioides plantarum TaxID=29299 RepID=A0ABV5K482_9ACTN|nr:hypothetical protein [Nocardioides plantarum]